MAHIEEMGERIGNVRVALAIGEHFSRLKYFLLMIAFPSSGNLFMMETSLRLGGRTPGLRDVMLSRHLSASAFGRLGDVASH
jgi:hypothetical protein